jgi:peptide/nickel transport system substrate-binding protein
MELSRRETLRRAGAFAIAAPTLVSLLDSHRRGGEQEPAVLTVGAIAPATAVDPVAGFDGIAIGLFQQVNEYLIWLENDLTLSPQLAASWEPERDGARWVITLRPDVTFSDGTPLDSASVVSSFQRILDPANGSPALAAFNSILAGDGVTAADDQTVVFDLLRPHGDFPSLISAGTYNAVILEPGYAGDWTSNPIGTGPFLLESYSPTEGARFVRNETYWDAGRPLIDALEVNFYRDNQAALIALQSGEVDTMLVTRLNLLRPIQEDDELEVDIVPGTGVNVLTMRVDTAPFDVKEVRQAVAVALDRAAINTTLALGLADLGNDHLVAPAFPTAPTDIAQREVDLAEVRRLLDAAEVDELSFTLTFEPFTRDYAILLQEQLATAGITVSLEELTAEAFYAGGPQETPWLNSAVTLVPWTTRTTPTQFVVPMVRTNGVWNGSKYASEDLDAAADGYDAAVDDAERRRRAHTIAELLHDDVPLVITWWAPAVRPYRTTWRGIAAHPAQFLDVRSVERA